MKNFFADICSQYIPATRNFLHLSQIETNRNTALTLACFQGRHEVVSLLVERQANVEHRAKVSRLKIELLIKPTLCALNLETVTKNRNCISLLHCTYLLNVALRIKKVRECLWC